MDIKQKILVAVTGMSPQIVTETLYALHTQHQWLPEEIHVLTTQTGAENIIGSLLGQQFFQAPVCGICFACYPFRYGLYSRDSGETGEPLADIRSPGENNLAADQIVRFIYDLCADEQTELHTVDCRWPQVDGVLYRLCVVAVRAAAREALTRIGGGGLRAKP